MYLQLICSFEYHKKVAIYLYICNFGKVQILSIYHQFQTPPLLLTKPHLFGYKPIQTISDPPVPPDLKQLSNYGMESDSLLIFGLLRIIRILS